MGNHPNFPGIPSITGALSLANANGTAFADFYTAPSGGSGVLYGRLRAKAAVTVPLKIDLILVAAPL